MFNPSAVDTKDTDREPGLLPNSAILETVTVKAPADLGRRWNREGEGWAVR